MRGHRLVSGHDLPIRMRCIPDQFWIWSILSGSALTGLSASQFGRAFKVSTGMTPHKWHLAIRIEYAKRMLTDREKRLVDIALEAGFSEQSHFTRAFTSANGISPNAWRRTRLD